MTRTTLIAFPVTLFAVWWMYVVARAGDGPGLNWGRVAGNAEFAVVITGVLYLVFVAIALLVLYLTRIRGHDVGVTSVLLLAVARFAVYYAIAVVAGSALGEAFCVFEEKSFEKDAAAFFAGAPIDPATHEPPLYSRQRWWPANAQVLISPLTMRK